MNQAIRERAEAYQKDMFILDEDQVRFDSIDIGSARYVAFKAGVEWILEQLPVIKLPSKLMPEAGINLENGQILATTDDCIIFYGNGKCDVAYREWTEDTGWRWKVKYGPAIEDDKVLFWMWNNLKNHET